jgi:O-antigen/teichoic acid export membrane protein
VVNIITFFTFIFLIYKNKILNLEQDKKEIKYKEYSKYFFITGMMSLFTILNSKIDILIIKYFFDDIQVSIYGIGSQLSIIVNIPFIVISNILMPKIAALFKKDKIIQINILCDFYRFVLLILSVFTLFLLAFFYEKLLILFFNENYLESYIVFIIIASSYLIVSLFAFNDLYLTYSGQEIKIAIFMFLSCLVNIFACLILVPNYGIIGAATALSLSNIFLFFLVFISNKKNNYSFIYIIRILFKNKFWLIKKL